MKTRQLDQQLRALGRAQANFARRLRELQAYDGEAAEDWTPETDSDLVPLRLEVERAERNLAEAKSALAKGDE